MKLFRVISAACVAALIIVSCEKAKKTFTVQQRIRGQPTGICQSDGGAASVQVCVNSAQDGDTVTLPVGTFTWSTPVTINKAITLQGAGVGSTIVRDAVQGPNLITWTLPANAVSRLTGIEFQNGGRTALNQSIIYFVGSNTNGSQLRMDHCNWMGLNGSVKFDTVIGVVDHCTVTNNIGWYVYDSKWNGGDWGDGSWADAPARRCSYRGFAASICTRRSHSNPQWGGRNW